MNFKIGDIIEWDNGARTYKIIDIDHTTPFSSGQIRWEWYADVDGNMLHDYTKLIKHNGYTLMKDDNGKLKEVTSNSTWASEIGWLNRQIRSGQYKVCNLHPMGIKSYLKPHKVY
jgi:hypothetical protein